MADDTTNQTQFEKFAVQVQSFQKTLYTLIASSFLFSAISAVVQGSRIADDPALVALTTLFGTVAGCAAVLFTYTSWSPHPSQAFSTVMRFDPKSYRLAIFLQFGLSLLGMYLYYVSARTGAAIALVAVSAGSFFFFQALVTSALVAKRIEEQKDTWQGLTMEQRELWITSERERRIKEIKEAQEIRELIQSSRETINKAAQLSNDIRKEVKESDRQRSVEKIHKLIAKIHGLTIRVRTSVAGERLLTSSERSAEARRALEFAEVWKNLRAEWAKETYEAIEQRKIMPIQLEGTDFEVFQRGVWFIALVPGELTKTTAKSTFENLEKVKSESLIPNAELMIFLGETAKVTAEGRRVLTERNVDGYRIGTWSRL